MPRHRLMLLVLGALSLHARADEPLSLEAAVERALEIATEGSVAGPTVELPIPRSVLG